MSDDWDSEIDGSSPPPKQTLATKTWTNSNFSNSQGARSPSKYQGSRSDSDNWRSGTGRGIGRGFNQNSFGRGSSSSNQNGTSGFGRGRGFNNDHGSQRHEDNGNEDGLSIYVDSSKVGKIIGNWFEPFLILLLEYVNTRSDILFNRPEVMCIEFL